MEKEELKRKVNKIVNILILLFFAVSLVLTGWYIFLHSLEVYRIIPYLIISFLMGTIFFYILIGYITKDINKETKG